MGNIAQRVLLAPLQDAMQLVQRAQAGPFHAYLSDRIPNLIAAALLMTLTSIGCAAGTLLFLGSTRSVLDLLVLLPRCRACRGCTQRCSSSCPS